MESPATARLQQLQDDPASALAPAPVSEWRWAKGPLYSVLPFELERDPYLTAKALASEPEQKEGAQAAGFDASGRICALRWFTGGGSSDRVVAYGASGAEVVARDATGTITNVWILEYAEQRLTRVCAPAFIECYGYDDEGRIVDIVCRGESTSLGKTYPYEHQWSLAYEARATRPSTIHLVASTDLPNGPVKLVYQAPAAKTRTLEQMRTALEKNLLAAIEKTLTTFDQDTGPISAIALAYAPGELALPILGVLTQSQLERRASAEGATGADLLNPAEYAFFDVDELFYDAAKAKEIVQEIRAAHAAEALESRMFRAIYVGLAKKLRRRLLKSLKVADPLIVYATDLETAELLENLAASNPKTALTALHKRGWL